MMQGPEPGQCSIPQVFAATGAAKFFLGPFKLGNATFFDETFPQSHAITSIALDEAFSLYGRGVEISVLLNIGPGIPSEQDCIELDLMSVSPMALLTRKFSWPKRKPASLKQGLPGDIESQEDLMEAGSRLSSPSESALRVECQRRLDIRARLKELYGDSGPDKYHHLGPNYSLEKASLNDVHAICRPQRVSTDSRSDDAGEVAGVVEQYWVNARA
jgi:hypothetical protein